MGAVSAHQLLYAARHCGHRCQRCDDNLPPVGVGERLLPVAGPPLSHAVLLLSPDFLAVSEYLGFAEANEGDES